MNLEEMSQYTDSHIHKIDASTFASTTTGKEEGKAKKSKIYHIHYQEDKNKYRLFGDSDSRVYHQA